MKYQHWIALMFFIANPVMAQLSPLEDEHLSMVSGQVSPAVEPIDTGAPKLVFDLEMRLNLDKNATTGALTNICSASGGVANPACNIGVSVNNRYSGAGTAGDPFRKDWLVFKNVTGSIKIENLQLTGQVVNVSNNNAGAPNRRAALALTFDPTKFIEIKKLGFESLAVETDTATEVNADGSLNAANTPGYRNNTLATTNTFDADKSRGFLGLDMTANITIAGTIKLFSCTRSTTGC